MASDDKKQPVRATVASCNLCPVQKSFARDGDSYCAVEARAWAEVHMAMHYARREA